ncbi:MarR family transcriptional regulator [Actinoplanes sp. NBRC 14428]|uniref:MarR family transcriptional regulator n=1 Tax=Pseudosporangium ferrugineum TaxID=439699 RepID=A0A2T0SBI3_9ACTN|nr:MarR family transcriptional regulator [Pseudosporangium ferrugineum]PRY30778.1 MarR family transcriptional regulator [Pseudosporangium ferrugineum]BCJ50334.1 MarR family transcriptional regulator [Actinoplanes sp. NBRC 14428]
MSPAPLNAEEELLWRSLLRIVATLPRLLDEDLVRATGVSLSEYVTLMNLSEAEDREMRLTELASAAGLSLSRVSRLIEDMRVRGLVTKRRAPTDTRGFIATLTPAGLERLRDAYPSNLASARRRVLDHVAPRSLGRAGQVLTAIADGMDTLPADA